MVAQGVPALDERSGNIDYRVPVADAETGLVARGPISGGSVTANGGITCHTLGSPSGAPTLIEVGMDQTLAQHGKSPGGDHRQRDDPRGRDAARARPQAVVTAEIEGPLRVTSRKIGSVTEVVIEENGVVSALPSTPLVDQFKPHTDRITAEQKAAQPNGRAMKASRHAFQARPKIRPDFD